MRSIGRFMALAPAERRLVAAAVGLLGAVRVGLWILPFRCVHGATRTLGKSRRRETDEPTVERIVWAVGAADRLVPGTTCLVRALAVQALLARRGHASQLRLGVTGGGGRAFEAHAWLERDGRVLIGGPVEAHYVPLPALDPRL